MEEIKLDVQLRDKIGSRKVKPIRRIDAVPAIIYGGKIPPLPVQVDRRSYEKIMRLHRGESTLFHLGVKDGDKKVAEYSVIVKEEQHDPVSDKLIHVDFQRISLKEKIEVKVPVATVGEAIGVKRDGGSLDHTLWELDIICFPSNIPAKLEVDVSSLGIGDVIHVKDLKLPEGVTTKHDPEAIVVSVVKSMKEDSEVAESEEDVEPEVIKKKEKTASAEDKD